MEKRRIQYFDIAKGIGILLMIAGHTLLQNKWALQFIYSFHMPLFFIISGYFFKILQGSGKLLRKSARRLIIPYIFTCLCVIAVAAIQQIIHGDYSGLANVLNHWIRASLYGSGAGRKKPFVILSIGAVWFLLALFFARYFFNCAMKLRSRYLQIGFIAVIAYIGYKTSQFIWLPFSIQAGMVATLFMLAGYAMRRINIFEREINAQYTIFAGLVWIFCIIFCGKLYMNGNDYESGFIDVIGAICGSYIILLLSKLIEKKSHITAKALTFYGRNTLAILCFHLIDLDTFHWRTLMRILKVTNTPYEDYVLLLFHIIWATSAAIIASKIPVIKNIFASAPFASTKENG